MIIKKIVIAYIKEILQDTHLRISEVQYKSSSKKTYLIKRASFPLFAFCVQSTAVLSFVQKREEIYCIHNHNLTCHVFQGSLVVGHLFPKMKFCSYSICPKKI